MFSYQTFSGWLAGWLAGCLSGGLRAWMAVTQARELKREWEQFREIDRLEAEVQGLRAEYGWSVHGEFEDQRDDAMKVRMRTGGRVACLGMARGSIFGREGLNGSEWSFRRLLPVSLYRHAEVVIDVILENVSPSAFDLGCRGRPDCPSC